MSYNLDAEARVSVLRKDNFEDLKTVLREIISEFNEKIDKVNDRLTELDLKIS